MISDEILFKREKKKIMLSIFSKVFLNGKESAIGSDTRDVV